VCVVCVWLWRVCVCVCAVCVCGWGVCVCVCMCVCVCVRTRNLLNVPVDLFRALLTSHILWLSTGPLLLTSPVTFHFGMYFLLHSKTPAISSRLPPKLRMYFYLYRKYTISKNKLTERQQIYRCISKYKPRIFESHSERKLYTAIFAGHTHVN